MKKSFLGWILFLICILGASWEGYQAWNAYTHPKVVVEWSTTSELEIVGFNIYRSESLEGNYLIINKNLIPSSKDPLVGGKYTFPDLSVRPGHTYYYLLEDVDVNGTTSRHEPIKAKAQVGGVVDLSIAIVLFLVFMVEFCVILRLKYLNRSFE